MNTRSWLVLLLFCGWTAGSWYWYTCKIKGYCGNTAAPVAKEQPVEKPKKPEVKVQYGPLTYNWKSSKGITTDKWASYFADIQSKGQEGQTLIVSGPYYNDESAPSGFENMGLARAASVRDMLTGKLDAKQVELAAHNLGDRDASATRFGETRFTWVTRNENVQETVNGAVIYFPYNSDQKISNPAIVSYLNQLASQMKGNSKSVQIIGHTDSKGSASYNKTLGKQRADAIRQLLVGKGLSANRILSSSRGEEQPIADNNTEEGRQKNRRTEIIIK